MTERMVSFREFSDPEVAGEITRQLSSDGIAFEIEKTAALLDSTFIGTSSDPTIIIKLRPSDFSAALTILRNYYKKETDSVDRTYYLFEFNDDELLEILQKPDEWGPLDYELAQKILKERGRSIDGGILLKLNSERKTVLLKPATAGNSLYVVGYFFIAYGVYSSVFPYTKLSLLPFLFLAPFFNIVIGHLIYKSKKTLPDGERVFTFVEEDRGRGRIMMYVGWIVFIVRTARYIFLSF